MIPIKHIWPALLLLCLPVFGQKQVIELPQPNLAALERVDRQSSGNRFAGPIPLNLRPSEEVGEWAANDGTNGRWELTFRLPGTHGLALFLDEVNLPTGGVIFLENFNVATFESKEQSWLGSRKIFTDFLPGDEVTLVYQGPVFQHTDQPFHIFRADHVYRPDIYQPRKSLLDFGNSNECQVNANCAAGADWEEEKSGTARIILVVEEGTGYCSGNLVNNTAEDGRPLFLTGFHCQDGFTPIYDLWRFDFGYRSVGCENPVSEPAFTAYTGAILRAGRQENDFLLLELADPAFDGENHYFAGWDRSEGIVAGDVYGFHHPQGDIQKMGRSNGMTILAGSIDWNNNVTTPPAHHFRMIYNLGTYQVGSSGSAVFDENHRIRGQLNGGNFFCPGTTTAFIGRLALSWTGGETSRTRLSDWLDPLGTEAITLDGATMAANTGGRMLRGTARWQETPVEDVRFVFNWGPSIDTVFTDAFGEYSLLRPDDATGLEIATSFEFGNELTGVNVVDIIAIRRHILSLDTLNAQELIATDVDNSGVESVSDIIQISRVILGLSDWVDRPNWIVYPRLLPITPLPVNVFGPFNINITNSNAGVITLDFEVLKNGDANLNAEPR
jgi:hypothetical protein